MVDVKIFTERGPLGELVVNIEFVVISIVAGIALSTLGASAADISSLEYLQYWPYVLTGMLFVLFFWSEAISHTISFIDWPMNLVHTFLYFLIGYFMMMALSNLADKLVWFLIFIIFQTLGLVELLYLFVFSKDKLTFKKIQLNIKSYKVELPNKLLKK